MNCKANGAIVRKNIFKNCFFQPASSDNGVSLGAALLAESKFEERLNIKASKLESIYKGTFYSDAEIEKDGVPTEESVAEILEAIIPLFPTPHIMTLDLHFKIAFTASSNDSCEENCRRSAAETRQGTTLKTLVCL